MTKSVKPFGGVWKQDSGDQENGNNYSKSMYNLQRNMKLTNASGMS